MSAKELMLGLVNEARAEAGSPVVVMGDNRAAQVHADSASEGCHSGHWGLDGLNSHMRYGLSGGYQSNSEVVSGLNYCIQPWENYAAIRNISDEVRESMEGFMGSPGHRRTILDGQYRKVNIGLAWNRYIVVAVLQFEGDYVEYDKAPELSDGSLSMSGRTKNGAFFVTKFGPQIYYRPPPHPLTRGQLASAYCQDSGLLVGALRRAASPGSYYSTDSFTKTYEGCSSPYDAPPDTPAPASVADAHLQHSIAKALSYYPVLVEVPWIDASQMKADGVDFAITADLESVHDKHGPGVYTVVIWGEINGMPTVISRASFFHGIPRPTGYD